MAKIERRQAQLRRIRARNFANGKPEKETVAISPESHHSIGKSENQHEHIGLFARRNSGDPAVKVRPQSEDIIMLSSLAGTGFHTQIETASAASNQDRSCGEFYYSY